MSLGDIVRSAVATVHAITNNGELTEAISLARWNGQDDQGLATYASTLTINAIVERKNKRIRTASGAETVATATVTILKPFAKLSPVVSGRREPVDPRDQVTLADGISGPIMAVDDGLADQSTNRPYLTQIFLG